MKTKLQLVLFAFGTVALVASTGVVAKRRVDREWGVLSARVDKAEAELESKVATERPVLHGEPHSGEAFEYYQRAIAMIPDDERAGGDANPTTAQIFGWTDEERASYRQYADQFAPLLAELRLGAQARRAKLVIDSNEHEIEWDSNGGLTITAVHWVGARRLSRIAFTAFVLELMDGRPEEGMRILLDGLQFARDLAATSLVDESGTGGDLLVSSSLRAFCLHDGWSRVPGVERERFLDALALVDESLVTHDDAIRAETVLTVREMESAIASGTMLDAAWTKTSTHAAHTMLFDFEEEYAAAFESEPLRRPSRVLQRFTRRAKSEGWYVERPLENFGRATTKRLRGLAHLRLLRYALAANSGREDLPTHGRLGLPIETVVEDGVRRAYLDTSCRDHFSRLEIEMPVW